MSTAFGGALTPIKAAVVDCLSNCLSACLMPQISQYENITAAATITTTTANTYEEYFQRHLDTQISTSLDVGTRRR